MDIIGKGISWYKKTELGVISKATGSGEDILREAGFYDVGYMRSEIERIKKDLKSVTGQLEAVLEVTDKGDYERERIQELSRSREYLLGEMVFLGTNSFSNLDYCLKLMEDHHFDLSECFLALRDYRDGDKEKAYETIDAACSSGKDIKDHFLISKVLKRLNHFG